MNVVIYTSDFEPITIIDLPREVMDFVEKQGVVRLALQEPTSSMALDEDEVSDINIKIVNIRAGKLKWFDGTTKVVLLTNDDELALMLRPSWLPGQQASINAYKKNVRMLTNRLVQAMRNNNK